ncbi:unnamed protein product [Brassica oleracea var. botrytis]|uniref:Protein kinase domain-containing protein n=1 Tax=Brassica oleracea TaxID=3712 RepID=A0A3P6DNB9_BRAOL|nr:unnamed protein product [Brassica oleracea]
MELHPSLRATTADLLKHPFMLRYCPPALRCPPPAMRNNVPRMMTMATRPGDFIGC